MPDTSSNNKRIAKNTLFMYFRMFVTISISLYTSRIVLAVLGFEDYGLYNVVGGIIAMFGFINFAMTNSTSRFITYYLGKGDVMNLSKVFSMASYIHIFIAILLVIIGETIGLWFLYNKMTIPELRINAAFWVYQLSIATTVVSVVSVPFNACIVAHEKMSAFAYMTILDAILKLIIVFLIKYSPYDKLIFYAVLLFMVSVIDRVIYGVYCKMSFEECYLKKVWDSKLLKDMLGIAGWTTLGNISYLFYSTGLNIILNMICGPVVNAARGIAVSVENIVKQFSQNVQTAINPQIIKSYVTADKKRMETLMFASSRYCFYLLYLISVPLCFEAPFVLNIWLGEYPEHAVNFLRLTLVIVLFDTMVNPLFTANLASGNLKSYNISFCSVSFIFIPIVYLILKYTKIPETVFICTICMNIFALLARLLITQKNVGINIKVYAKEVLAKVFVVVVVSIIPPSAVYILMPDNIIRFIVLCCISFLSSVINIYLFGILKEERYIVNEKLKNLIRKLL